MSTITEDSRSNLKDQNERIIDIVDATYTFDIDENLFTEDRGNWTMNNFNMKTRDNIKRGRHSRRLQQYYAEQQELIDQFSKIDEMLECIQKGEDYTFDEVDSQSGRARLAISVSFVVNIILLILKAIALARTGSLAVLTSLGRVILYIINKK